MNRDESKKIDFDQKMNIEWIECMDWESRSICVSGMSNLKNYLPRDKLLRAENTILCLVFLAGIGITKTFYICTLIWLRGEDPSAVFYIWSQSV